MEREARVDEAATLRRTTQSLETQVAQSMKDVQLDLEAEVGRRNATLERCERRITELRTTLGADIAQCVCERFESELGDKTKAFDEIQDRMRSLSEALLTESKARAAGHEETSHLATQAKFAVDREAAERRAACEETARKLQELMVAWEQEKADREMGDTSARGQLTNLREQLTTEREERINECSNLKRAAQRAQGQLQEQDQDFKAQLEAATGRRAAADERMERQCGEIRASIMQEEIARVEVCREMERSIRAVRIVLEHGSNNTGSPSKLNTTTEVHVRKADLDGNLSSRVDAALSSRLGVRSGSPTRVVDVSSLGQLGDRLRDITGVLQEQR
eukprot:NODE_4749_length_1852_cov_4.829565.p1 GENE.NODE_4749_length_1852_cov_4.829565~~NODE_4749_length_1852_cov_4.829565.p1  ORF type:complete len:394 (+),score=113.11 NODE_4749_length_1852_cov_4.829565:178-1182(+)